MKTQMFYILKNPTQMNKNMNTKNTWQRKFCGRMGGVGNAIKDIF